MWIKQFEYFTVVHPVDKPQIPVTFGPCMPSPGNPGGPAGPV